MPNAPQFDVTFLTRPENRGGGDYLHRTYWPAAALAEHLPCTAIQLSHPDCLEAIACTRLLVVTMVMDVDLRRVFDERRARGLPTIYEISDDFEAFPDNLPLCKFYAQPWVRELARELCRKADAVQFSSPRLARKYASLNPVHRVLHNQAWEVPAEPRTIGPTAPGPLRVGWAGMAGHYEDCTDLAEFLAPSFGKRSEKAFAPNKVSLRLMTTPRIAETLSNAGIAFGWQSTGTMADYGRFLDSLDVGIGHCSKRDFALGRTDGKFIEYTTRGVVSVCCNRGTYAETIRHDDIGVLYGSPRELREQLARLRQPEVRQQLIQHAHAELASTRNHRSAALERLAFYREVEERCRARQPAKAPARSRLSPARGFHHAIHAIEDDLQAALMRHRDAASPELLQTYWQLAQRAPDFFRIWDALLKAYCQLGLTENLVPLEQRAALSRSLAFERAFGASQA